MKDKIKQLRKEVDQLKNGFKNLAGEGFQRGTQVLKNKVAIEKILRELKELDQITSINYQDNVWENKQSKKLLQRIVWLEKALKVKADKKDIKSSQLKVEVRKTAKKEAKIASVPTTATPPTLQAKLRNLLVNCCFNSSFTIFLISFLFKI